MIIFLLLKGGGVSDGSIGVLHFKTLDWLLEYIKLYMAFSYCARSN